MDGIRLYAFQQLLMTFFLAALSWSFYARLRAQGFFRWWLRAWTWFAVCALLMTAMTHLPQERPLLRGSLLLLTTAFGVLQIPLLLAYGWIFLRRGGRASSRASAVTGVFCVLYALTQALYAAATIRHFASGGPGAPPGHPLLDLALLVRSPLSLFDLFSGCGIVLGMGLLLVEEHGRSEHALVETVSRSREIAERNLDLEAQIAERQRAEAALRTAEAALRESQARHRAILAALPDLMFLQSKDGVYLDYHARDSGLLLAKPEEFLGRNMKDILPPALAAEFSRSFERAVETGDLCEIEYAVPVQDGVRRFEARVVRCDADSVLSIVRDITERRRAEDEVLKLREELAHVGRVTLLGTLTGSLAHEINQPLTAVMANAQAALRMLSTLPPDLAELRRILEDIVADNRRAGEVIQRLRSFLRKGTPERAPLDVNATVQEVVRLLNSDILGRRVSVEVELEARAPGVLGDRVQLQQVVLNLLVNAFDAMEDVEVGVRRVVLRTSGKDGEVVVSVADHGVGVPDDRLPHIFEPFYTTKAEGMGLGLPICRAIIEAHGGELHAERNSEGGMTFLFSLPASRFLPS